MGFLALGLSGETYVTADIITYNGALSAAIARAAMVFLTSLWFARQVSTRGRSGD